MLHWHFAVRFWKQASCLVSESSYERGKKTQQDKWNNSFLCTSADFRLSVWQETRTLYSKQLLAYADLA